mgnify:CR=1 FL=1
MACMDEELRKAMWVYARAAGTSSASPDYTTREALQQTCLSWDAACQWLVRSVPEISPIHIWLRTFNIWLRTFSPHLRYYYISQTLEQASIPAAMLFIQFPAAFRPPQAQLDSSLAPLPPCAPSHTFSTSAHAHTPNTRSHAKDTSSFKTPSQPTLPGPWRTRA